MAEQYKAPDGTWKPVATVVDTHSPVTMDLSKGLASTSSGFAAGATDELWDHVTPTFTNPSAYKAFAGALYITRVPQLNTTGVRDMQYMFEGCSSLTDAPALDTSAVTNMQYMFRGCSSLTSVPAMGASTVTNMLFMFYGCAALASAPAMDTSAVTSMNNMFYGCKNLTGVPAYNMGALSSASGASILGMPNSTSNAFPKLVFFKAYGSRYGFSVAYTALGADALNELFTNLGAPSGSQTINITGTPGAATCDRTIATNKGWTVTG